MELLAPLLALVGISLLTNLADAWRLQRVLQRAEALCERDSRPEANRLLERAERGWWLSGKMARAFIAAQLSAQYWLDQRWADGEGACRRALEQARALQPGLAVTLRLRLADCLEGQGRQEEAQQQREEVDRFLESQPPNPMTLFLIAQKLEAEQRLDEACDTYRRAVELPLTGALQSLRDTRLLACANCHWQALRPESALRYADEALSLDLTPARRAMAEGIGALALRSLYRFEDARTRIERALEWAAKADDPAQQANYLCLLSETCAQSGEMSRAIDLAERALTAAPGAPWFGLGARAEVLWRLGRFDEALEDVARAREHGAKGTPAQQRRLLAALATLEATILAETDRLDAARQSLDTALTGMADSLMTRLWFHADRTWILASAGEAVESIREARLVQILLSRVPAQSLIHIGITERLGIAQFYRGEYVQSQQSLERLLRALPSRFSRSRAHYYLGRCHDALGEVEAAREAYRQAISSCDGLFADRARTRLAA